MTDPFTVPPYSEQFLAGKSTDTRLAVIMDILLGRANTTQNPTPVNPVPVLIAGGATYSSGAMAANGNSFAASALLTQNGSLTLQRYIDAAGVIPIGDLITQAITANTLATVAVADGLPCVSWIVSIINSSGSVGNLSEVVFLEKK